MAEDTLLALDHIEKNFGEAKVLRGISLTVKAGEFVTLLGPSGCGKTTTLRIIAGLEKPDAGHVYLAGEDVTDLEPNRRNVNTVFQSYALFPHMNVEANIGYSLRLKRADKKLIHKTVEEALELVQLSGFGKRMPSELSGGQRQRVAIARAVVNHPRVLLLDEPLGALDLQLRRQMQLELKRLQKQLGITFIYITHDQEEAINMSDRIAVMRAGEFVQIGTPDEVYETPKTAFAARFVGNANVLQGDVVCTEDGFLRVETDGGVISCRARKNTYAGERISYAVRSENVQILEKEGEGIPTVVKEKSFVGGMLRIVLVTSSGAEVVASRHGINSAVLPGQKVRLSWARDMAVQVEEDDPS